jgi:magnesium transporter
MIERFMQGKVQWVNLKSPTRAEIQQITQEFDIYPALMTDLTTPVPKNSALNIGSTIKITLDFPVVKRTDMGHPTEVKFFITKQFLLTIQYEEMEGIDRYKRQFEVATTLKKAQKNLTGAHFFISLINNLYDSASSKLDYIESKLADIEDDIFKDNERQLIYAISSVSKKLITFRHILRGHDEVFHDIRPLFTAIYGDIFTNDLQSIQGQYFLLQRHTNTLFDTLTALRETNTAMITTRQNEVIKNLTVMAFIAFPLTLLSSIFGMNTVSAPIIGGQHDFFIILGIMFSVATAFFLFFKRKRWIQF